MWASFIVNRCGVCLPSYFGAGEETQALEQAKLVNHERWSKARIYLLLPHISGLSNVK